MSIIKDYTQLVEKKKAELEQVKLEYDVAQFVLKDMIHKIQQPDAEIIVSVTDEFAAFGKLSFVMQKQINSVFGYIFGDITKDIEFRSIEQQGYWGLYTIKFSLNDKEYALEYPIFTRSTSMYVLKNADNIVLAKSYDKEDIAEALFDEGSKTQGKAKSKVNKEKRK